MGYHTREEAYQKLVELTAAEVEKAKASGDNRALSLAHAMHGVSTRSHRLGTLQANRRAMEASALRIRAWDWAQQAYHQGLLLPRTLEVLGIEPLLPLDLGDHEFATRKVTVEYMLNLSTKEVQNLTYGSVPDNQEDKSTKYPRIELVFA